MLLNGRSTSYWNLILTISLCSGSFSLMSQTQFGIHQMASESQGIFEYESHYYVSNIENTGLYGDYDLTFYKLDIDLNKVDSIVFDLSEEVEEGTLFTGRFEVREGQLEYSGVMSTMDDLSGTMPSLDDSTYFARITFDDSFVVYSFEYKFLAPYFFFFRDIVKNDELQRYEFSCADFLIGYWVGFIDFELQESMISDMRFLELAGIEIYNPFHLTKVIDNPFHDGVQLMVHPSKYDFYNSSMQYDSTYVVPLVVGVPGVPWMTQGVAYLDGSFIVGASNNLNSTFWKLDYPGIHIDQIGFSFNDSLATSSLYRSLDMDSEKNLYLGMHIRHEDEEYAKNMKVIKCDTLGNVFWQKVFGEGLEVRYQHREIMCTNDGGVLMMADRYSDPEAEEPDAVILFKLDENGQVVGEVEWDRPSFALDVFPNPASEILNLPSGFSGFEFRVYDSSGRNCTSGIIDGSQLDIHGLANGMHILELTKKESLYRIPFVINK